MLAAASLYPDRPKLWE